jgi:hypothetical protein
MTPAANHFAISRRTRSSAMRCLSIFISHE